MRAKLAQGRLLNSLIEKVTLTPTLTLTLTLTLRALTLTLTLPRSLTLYPDP